MDRGTRFTSRRVADGRGARRRSSGLGFRSSSTKEDDGRRGPSRRDRVRRQAPGKHAQLAAPTTVSRSDEGARVAAVVVKYFGGHRYVKQNSQAPVGLGYQSQVSGGLIKHQLHRLRTVAVVGFLPAHVSCWYWLARSLVSRWPSDSTTSWTDVPVCWGRSNEWPVVDSALSRPPPCRASSAPSATSTWASCRPESRRRQHLDRMNMHVEGPGPTHLAGPVGPTGSCR